MMPDSVNDKILNATVRHAHYIERLKAHEANKIVEFISQKVLPKVIKRTAGVNSKYTQKRLEQLEKSLRELVDMNPTIQQMQENMYKVALSESEFQLKMIGDAMPIDIETALPSLPNLRSMVRGIKFGDPETGKIDTIRGWFDSLKVDTRKRIYGTVEAGIAQGETAGQIADRVMKAAEQTQRGARAIVRTATNAITTQAREMTYKENSDIVKEVEYVATLDSRTTEICAGLDGKTFPIDEGARPPMHFNCRSTTVPVIKSFKELGLNIDVDKKIEAELDGRSPDKITYGSWLKKQPASVQEEVLGKTKARLFRTGKVDISSFTDSQNRPMTLKQLRKAEGLSAEDVAVKRGA